jgi:hypothetical protein
VLALFLRETAPIRLQRKVSDRVAGTSPV